ncbi:MAG: arginine repressor [Chitinophagales bacterium]
MKGRRHAAILEAVRTQPIATQGELTEYLKARGIAVTQATVSRDIKDLRLVKVPTGDGRYCYALPPDRPEEDTAARTRRMLSDFVLSVDSSENLIMLKTGPGTAQAVAAALDGLGWPDIVGTVAGDDSILVVVRVPAAPGKAPSRGQRAARRVIERLLELRG